MFHIQNYEYKVFLRSMRHSKRIRKFFFNLQRICRLKLLCSDRQKLDVLWYFFFLLFY